MRFTCIFFIRQNVDKFHEKQVFIYFAHNVINSKNSIQLKLQQKLKKIKYTYMRAYTSQAIGCFHDIKNKNKV